MTSRFKLVLVGVLYFAEGFPFGTVMDILPVYFRFSGVSLKDIGLLSLATLPWSLKFLWAPLVDYWGRVRNWIWVAELGIAGLMVSLALVKSSEPSFLLWACIMMLAAFSATQDIAVDAYTIRLLSIREMGAANGVRVSSYRAALILSGGAMVALGGWIGWNWVFAGSAAIMVLCAVCVLRMPYVGDVPASTITEAVKKPFKDFLTRPKALAVLAFVLCFKLGDMAMGPMVRPFWVDRGLSSTEIGLITGTFGIVAAVLGALAGGVYTTRKGIFRGLWVLGLWQAVSNLGYAVVAQMPFTGHWGVYAASLIESFCGGLGTASFLAFLMSICRKEMAATQYALLSALFGLARSLSGALSGWATTEMGYGLYFAFTFLLAFPAYAFLPAVKMWIPENHSTSEETG
ncbi:MAG: MFS transporter [Deltaproteobacteria bacterium]|nr:MFS transporter [Deltaproteobacteria bacterium]